MTGGCLTLAFANWLKKFRHSPDKRPPTSQARTTNRARPLAPESLGYVVSLRRLARTSAAPSTLANCGPGLPSPLTGDTMVVSMASCAPWKSGNPTTSRRLWSWAPRGGKSRSLTRTLAAALSSAKPLRPKTPDGHTGKQRRTMGEGARGGEATTPRSVEAEHQRVVLTGTSPSPAACR